MGLLRAVRSYEQRSEPRRVGWQQGVFLTVFQGTLSGVRIG